MSSLTCGLGAYTRRHRGIEDDKKKEDPPDVGYRTAFPVAWFGQKGWELDRRLDLTQKEDGGEGRTMERGEGLERAGDYLASERGSAPPNPPLDFVGMLFDTSKKALRALGAPRDRVNILANTARLFASWGALALLWLAVALLTLVCLAYEAVPSKYMQRAVIDASRVPEAFLTWLQRRPAVNSMFDVGTTFYNTYHMIFPGDVLQDMLRVSLMAPAVIAENINRTRALCAIVALMNASSYGAGWVMEELRFVPHLARAISRARLFLTRRPYLRGLADFLPGRADTASRLLYTLLYGVAGFLPMLLLLPVRKAFPAATHWFLNGIDVATVLVICASILTIFVGSVFVSRFFMSVEEGEYDTGGGEGERRERNRFGGTSFNAVYFANASIVASTVFVLITYVFPSFSKRETMDMISTTRKWLEHDAGTDFAKFVTGQM